MKWDHEFLCNRSKTSLEHRPKILPSLKTPVKNIEPWDMVLTVLLPLGIASNFSVVSVLYFCSSGVKLLFGNEADCKVEVTLLLMLSLVDSDSSC